MSSSFVILSRNLVGICSILNPGSCIFVVVEMPVFSLASETPSI